MPQAQNGEARLRQHPPLHGPRRRSHGELFAAGLASSLVLGLLAACQPQVQVQAPKEPITINLNIKLDADVRVQLEEKAKEDIQANPDVF